MGATLTAAEREELKYRLEGIERDKQRVEARAKPFRDRLKPFEEKLRQFEERTQIALEDYGLDTVEYCCGCNAFLITSDLVCHTDDGEYLCEACAPDWTDVARSIEQETKASERAPDEHEACILALARERIAEGRGGEKAVLKLG